MANAEMVFDVTPSDEVIKLTCLQAACRFSNTSDPIALAKQMYEWVKESKGNFQSPGARFGSQNKNESHRPL